MANKRMFSLSIIDTDAFSDMPATSKLLYYELAMRADDEGFVGNPKKIMREVGGGDDSYKILLAKKFIIQFESGICVIKHWLIHNTIRMDRFNETTYINEKSQLLIKNNKAYKLIEIEDNVDYGNHLATMVPQVKLSKVNLREEASLSYLEQIAQELIEELTEKFKCDSSQVKSKADALVDYCRAKGKAYKNYKSLLSNALRKDFGERPPKAKVPIYDTSSGVAKIIGYK